MHTKKVNSLIRTYFEGGPVVDCAHPQTQNKLLAAVGIDLICFLCNEDYKIMAMYICSYRMFSIKCQIPIKRQLCMNAGSKTPIFKQTSGAFNRAPAFIRGRGHKDQLQVYSNLLNGTVKTYQTCTVWPFWYFNKRAKEKYWRNIQCNWDSCCTAK